MGKATITLNTNTVEKRRIDDAAAAAGMSTSAYVLSATRARMTRDAAEVYRRLIVDNPDFVAESAEARRFALGSAARVRAHRGDAA